MDDKKRKDEEEEIHDSDEPVSPTPFDGTTPGSTEGPGEPPAPPPPGSTEGPGGQG